MLHLIQLQNSLLLGIIPANGTKEPHNISPYLELVVDELLCKTIEPFLLQTVRPAPSYMEHSDTVTEEDIHIRTPTSEIQTNNEEDWLHVSHLVGDGQY